MKAGIHRRLVAVASAALAVAVILVGGAQAATSGDVPGSKGLEDRSAALNEMYGGGISTAALDALRERSEALNEMYGTRVGSAPVQVGGFDWSDVGIGIGMAFGAMLLGAAGVLALRRRGRLAQARS